MKQCLTNTTNYPENVLKEYDVSYTFPSLKGILLSTKGLRK